MEFVVGGRCPPYRTARKKRYRKFKQTVTIGEGEEKEVEVEMRRTSKKIRGLFLMDDGQ